MADDDSRGFRGKRVSTKTVEVHRAEKYLTPSVTKAPPPIVPLQTNGCASSTQPPKRPDWNYWRQFPALELWQLVALSCDMDPRRFGEGRWKPSTLDYSASDCWRFQEWYEIAMAHEDAPELQRNGSKIGTALFLAFTARKGWTISEDAQREWRQAMGLEPADFSLWLDSDEWTWLQAAHLLCGLEPVSFAQFDPADKDSQPKHSDRWRVALMYDKLKGACRAGIIQDWSDAPPIRMPDGTETAFLKSNRVRPFAAVKWAKDKAFAWNALPPELDAIKAPDLAPRSPEAPAISVILSESSQPESQESQRSQALETPKRKGARKEYTPEERAELERRYTPTSPGGRLRREDVSGLKRIFRALKDRKGRDLPWEKFTGESTRFDIQCVPRERDGRSWLYDPEGIALWLMDDPEASTAPKDVARCIAAHLLDEAAGAVEPQASELRAKAEWWSSQSGAKGA